MIQALVAAVVMLSACPTPRDPERSQRRVDLCKDLLGKGDDSGAESECKKALVYDPRNEEAHNVYGIVWVYRAYRNVDLVERAECLSGTEERNLREEADAAMIKAGTHFMQAVKLAPDFGEAWMNRGVVAMHDAQWDKAIEYLDLSLQNGARLTSEALARTNLGWAQYKNGDLAHATTELLRALQLEPNFCLARYRLAQVYFDRERFDEAAELLAVFSPSADGKAALCERPVLEAYYLGGQNSLRSHDIESAVPWFQRCIEAAPRSCMARKCEKALAELGGP